MAVSYSEELLARAEAWANSPLVDKRSATGLQELARLYTAITGQGVSSCRQCQYSDYSAVVVAYVRQSTQHFFPHTVAESKYTIANGLENEQFVHEGWNKVVTAENLTDEDAEHFIKHGFVHAFVLKPGAKAAKTTPEPAKLERKADYQARFKELFGEEADGSLTIAQLTEHIEAKEADADYALPAAE